MKFHASILAVALAVLASEISPASSWSSQSYPVRTSAVTTTAATPSVVASSSTRLFSSSAVEPSFVDNISKYKNAEDVYAFEADDDEEEEAALVVSIPTVASVFVATVGTFALNNYLNVGAVGASGVAGLLAALGLPEKLAVAALCGSFCGMASLAVVPGMWSAGILGLACAAFYTLFDNRGWLDGVGGRLGFIAQCACTLQFLVTFPHLFNAPTAAATFIGETPKIAPLLAELPTVVSFTTLGALFVRYWKDAMTGMHIDLLHSQTSSFSFLGKLFTKLSLSITRRMATSVGAVGATGLLASLLLPASVAGPAFCGAFIAKSAPTVIPTVNGLVPACIFAGVAQLALSGVMLGGWGGKLGTAALMGVLSYSLFRDDDLLVNEDDLDEEDDELPEVTMVKAFQEASPASPSDDVSQLTQEQEFQEEGTPEQVSMMQATPQEATVPARQVPVMQAVSEPRAAAPVEAFTPTEPTTAQRQVYTFKAENQAPVVKSSVASAADSMQMSVLMAVEGKLESPVDTEGEEEAVTQLDVPTEPTRTPVYTFEASNNQKPVSKTSVASSGDNMEMSVLLTVEGKLEESPAAVLNEAQVELSSNTQEEAIHSQDQQSMLESPSVVPQANYYVVRKSTPNQATSMQQAPTRSLQADSPVFASQGNERGEYVVPSVIPVGQEVLPRSSQIGPFLDNSL